MTTRNRGQYDNLNHEGTGSRIRPASKEVQKERAIARIASTTLADLQPSFEARRDFGSQYGYATAAEWWETEQRVYGLDDSLKPAWVTDEPQTAPAATVEDDEVTAFVRGYTGTFSFLLSLKGQLTTRGTLSEKQYAAAAKCYRQEQEFQARKAQRAEQRAATPAFTATEGMYRKADGTIYKVQRAVNGSGNLYAKKLVRRTATGNVFGTVDQGTWKFEYAPGAIRTLTADEKMTVDEARAFGALYGTCCVCGRTLTDETSIAHGIGPICEGRMVEWA